MDDEVKDPVEELKKNIEFISPVKRCPKCGKMSLEFDEKSHAIRCSGCGFERSMPKMK